MNGVEMEHRVESYFSSLNSMASRIMVEKEWAKKSVDVNQWSRMSDEERTRFLSDSFISKPQIGTKYSYCLHSKPDVESFPKLDVRSGEKYIVVDEGEGGGTIVRGERGVSRRRGSIGSSMSSTWRDEHSGPFTWETQSQLDLSFGNGDVAEKKSKNKAVDGNVKVDKPCPQSDSFQVYRTKKMEKQLNGKCFDKPRPPPPPPTSSNNNNKQSSNKVNQMKCPPPKPPPKGISPNAKMMMMNELESVVLNKFDSVDDHDRKKKKKQQNRMSSSNKEVSLLNTNEVVVHDQLKPMKSEPIPKSDIETTLSTSMNDLTLNVDLSPGEDSDIPKTGFDFLDNW